MGEWISNSWTFLLFLFVDFFPEFLLHTHIYIYIYCIYIKQEDFFGRWCHRDSAPFVRKWVYLEVWECCLRWSQWAFPTIRSPSASVCVSLLPLRKLIIASEEGALVVASAGGTKKEMGKMWGWKLFPQPVDSGHGTESRMPCVDRLVKDVKCSHDWLLGQAKTPDTRFPCQLSW